STIVSGHIMSCHDRFCTWHTCLQSRAYRRVVILPICIDGCRYCRCCCCCCCCCCYRHVCMLRQVAQSSHQSFQHLRCWMQRDIVRTEAQVQRSCLIHHWACWYMTSPLLQQLTAHLCGDETSPRQIEWRKQ